MKKPMETIAIVVALLAPCPAFAKDELARGYYWDLPLHKPESSVNKFIDSYNDEDYLTAYLILSRDNQAAWNKACMQMSVYNFMDSDSAFNKQDLNEDVLDKGLEHFAFGTWYSFSNVLNRVVKSKNYPLNLLKGKLDVVKTDIEDKIAKVMLATEEGEQILFVMTLSTGKMWRLSKIEIQLGGEQVFEWPNRSATGSNLD